MSNVWFCSDLHFGHKNIQKYRKEVSSEEDNRNRIKADWNYVVKKQDVVYVLGDVCFTMETLEDFKELPAYKKYLIRGNHDRLDTQAYLKYFDSVEGLLYYGGFWLSHAPIHPDELRNRVNLHGHVHYHSVQDIRYFNCCPEALWPKYGRCLVSLHELRKQFNENNIRC